MSRGGGVKPFIPAVRRFIVAGWAHDDDRIFLSGDSIRSSASSPVRVAVRTKRRGKQRPKEGFRLIFKLDDDLGRVFSKRIESTKHGMECPSVKIRS